MPIPDPYGAHPSGARARRACGRHLVAVAQLSVDAIETYSGWRLGIAGELDLSTAPILVAELDHVLERTDSIEIDLSRVSFMDSQGLGVLLRAESEVPGRSFTVVDASPQARRLLAVTGLANHFGLPPLPEA
ncbi:MAG: STAS domain-containing protein [Acidimicrobiales bacterium]